MRIGGNDEIVGCRCQHFRDAVDHVAGQAQDFFFHREDEAYDMSFSGAEADTCGIGFIANLACDHSNTFFRVRTNIWSIFQST